MLFSTTTTTTRGGGGVVFASFSSFLSSSKASRCFRKTNHQKRARCIRIGSAASSSSSPSSSFSRRAGSRVPTGEDGGGEDEDDECGTNEDVSGVETTRRRTMGGVLGAGAMMILNASSRGRGTSARAQEKEEEEEEKNTQEFTFKTFALRTPSYFKEVDVDYEKGGLRGANGLELLIRDSRLGLAGNTVMLNKQRSPMDPNTNEPLFSATEDLGNVEKVAEKLVAGENERSKGAKAVLKGGAKAVLKEAKKETVDGITYYDVSYTKKVSFVDRIVRTRVCVHDNVLFTLTVETDLERGTGEEAQSLDDIVTSFKVL